MATSYSSNSSLQVAPLPSDFPFIPIGHPDTMMSKESVRKAVEEFRVRPSDVIVSTFAKTGTTLVCWICHMLRCGAQVDFDTIDTLYEVVPWPLLSWDIGYDPNVDGSQFFPRVFKSHLRMASVYRGCKYIVTVRDPGKTAISFYNFFLAKKVPIASTMDVSSFLMETPFVQGREGRASIWEYYQEYHLLKDCPCVLVLVYEDVVKNMKNNIRYIADFMGLDKDDVTDELISKVLSMSTKEFMAGHVTLFDEPYERAKKLGRAGDISQLAPGAKVALQKHRQQLNGQAQEFLQEKWDETMKPLGYATYQDFARLFQDINRRRFKNED